MEGIAVSDLMTPFSLGSSLEIPIFWSSFRRIPELALTSVSLLLQWLKSSSSNFRSILEVNYNNTCCIHLNPKSYSSDMDPPLLLFLGEVGTDKKPPETFLCLLSVSDWVSAKYELWCLMSSQCSINMIRKCFVHYKILFDRQINTNYSIFTSFFWVEKTLIFIFCKSHLLFYNYL